MSTKWNIAGFHHVTFRSANLAESKKFYNDVLGFKVLLEQSDLVIVQAGDAVLAIRGPDDATPPDDNFSPFRIGLDHLAFALEDEEEIRRFGDFLKEKGIWHVGPKTDPLLDKLYVAFKDPDGIKLEFYQS